MSQDKAPAFMFYPKDWESDENVKLMSLEEEGAYLRLLCHQWVHGSIPGEISEISKIFRTRPVHGSKLWSNIKKCFSQNGDGRWVNHRLETERLKLQAHREKRAAAGRKGASRKWDGNAIANAWQTDGKRDGNAIVLPMANDSIAIAIASNGSPPSPPTDERAALTLRAQTLIGQLAAAEGKTGQEILESYSATPSGAKIRALYKPDLSLPWLSRTVDAMHAALQARMDKARESTLTNDQRREKIARECSTGLRLANG